MADELPPDENSAVRDAEMIAAAREIAAKRGWPTEDGASASAPPIAAPLFRGPPPDSFTGYSTLEEIHRGGQGVIYLATQQSTGRKVAIKVMREGPFAGAADQARFDREVHILGQLNHPNIVTIHDSGSAAGHHYFVMNYVPGQPLDAYIAGGDRSIDETLRLFAKVCEAVNAAHLRGVIHRDLKPSNIRIDADGEPRILDLGLAKVAVTTGAPPFPGAGDGSSAPGAETMTQPGQFVGSLPWASPEQAEGVPAKIDLRTDVYSLGVILYHMLTGRFPYDVTGNMRDVIDNILTTQPVRPSVGVASGGPARRSSVIPFVPRSGSLLGRLHLRRSVASAINNDVETIVLKCLHKERERRYQTAGELARDVDRYLNGEPIEAKRDSAWYVLCKQLQRYRTPTAVVAAFVALLAAASVVSSALYIRSEEQRKLAQANEAAAKAEREAALVAKDAETRQRNAAELQAYTAYLRAAQSALSLHDVPGLRRYLDAAPGALRGWEWRYLDSRSDSSLMTLSGHSDGIRDLAFSPDGGVIASAGKDKTVRLWDANTGEELRRLDGHSYRVKGVKFVPNSRRLVSCSDDTTLRIWDTTSGVCESILSGHARWVNCVDVSPAGDLIASGSEDGAIKLWDIEHPSDPVTLRPRGGVILCIAFSPDGALLASGSGGHDPTIRVWDVQTRTQRRELKHEAWIDSLAFSPGGDILASSAGYNIKLWKVGTGKLLQTIATGGAGTSDLAFGHGGRSVLAATDFVVRAWDVASAQPTGTWTGYQSIVGTIASSPDGMRLAAADFDWLRETEGVIKVWDLSYPEADLELPGHTDRVRGVAVSPNGATIASASWDGTVMVWDSVLGDELATLTGHSNWVECVAFSHDGRRIASGSRDRTARTWDADTGALLSVFNGHRGEVVDIACAPNDEQMATAGWDGTLRIWDIASGRLIKTITGHTDRRVHSVSYSPDGRHILSCGRDRTVRLWNSRTGEQVREFIGHNDEVMDAVFLGNGETVASADRGGNLALWSAKTGKRLRTWTAHGGRPIYALVSLPNGRIVSGGWDRLINVWSMQAGDLLLSLGGHVYHVSGIAVSPDARWLVSGSGDRTLRMWDSAPVKSRAWEHEAMLAAADKARPLVDRLRMEGGAWKTIAERLRADKSLGKLVRRAALNEVLRRAAPQQEPIRDLLDSLFAKLMFTDDVVAALKADESLEAGFRRDATESARRRGDDPERLNDESWRRVRDSCAGVEAYAIGLRGAETAAEANPGTGYVLTTLGAAQYRVGKYEDALVTLTKADEINSQTERFQGGHPADIAFIAMSLHQLGRHQEVKSALERLRGLMRLERWANDEESQAFLREAEALVTGASEPTTQPVR